MRGTIIFVIIIIADVILCSCNQPAPIKNSETETSKELVLNRAL